MALAPGHRVGRYEIRSVIGAGGMGEVYRAHDTTLERDVAVKVLPEAYAHDPDRLARFEREAKSLAALNHPHIAQVYGLETTADGAHALAMELVEGEDLAVRIARGPIPLEEALAIARQIAEALETAHEQGIVHRDLKPSNIRITAKGEVKVLDFGLAKLVEPGGTEGVGSTGGAVLSRSPTLSMQATQAGVILGTAAYMAPEQAKGYPADARSDIWAFGIVLYEMLCGVAAFRGDDLGDILAAVVRGEPDWNLVPEGTPPTVRLLLQRCLRKDRTLRLQAMGDARIEIHEALSAPAPQPSAAVANVSRLGKRTAIVIGAGGLLLGSVMAGLTAWTLKPPPPRFVTRVAVSLPSGERLPALQTPVLALSPDGSQIAFISDRNGAQRIYVRPFDSAEAKAVAGTEGANSFTFSPDGRWLAFGAGGNLMRVSLSGGAPITICSAPFIRGLTWGENDTIVFAATYGTNGLLKVSVSGGKPQALTSPPRNSDSSEEAHRWPQLLPGGNAVLFTAWSRNLDDAQIVVQRLDSSERRVVLRGGTYARYVPSGHLVYVRAGTLMAVPFNLSRLEAIGDPVPLAQSVLLTAEGAAQFDVSNNGSLVHVPGGLQGRERQLTWVDRSGKEEAVGAPPRAYVTPRISPDGRQIAVAVQGANDDVWTYDIPRETLTRLTFEARSITPVWMADGKRIVYRSVRNGTLNLFAKAADGSGGEERLTTSEENQTPMDASRDGQALLFNTAASDPWVLPLTGDKKPRRFAQTPFAETGGVFSPNSHWIAYSSNESGRSEVYVQPFPIGGRKVQISRDGGEDPRWSAGGELFFRSGAKMVAVKVSTEPALTVAQPEVIFEGQQYATGSGTFDVSPDGKRLLMIKEPEQTAVVTQINVVLNWFDELTRLVPVK